MAKPTQSKKTIKLEKRYGEIGISAVQSAARYSDKRKNADAPSKDEAERLKRVKASRR